VLVKQYKVSTWGVRLGNISLYDRRINLS